jgi:putative drug exporter of the RND superfamily
MRFEHLGHWIFRHRKSTLAIGTVLLIVAGVIGFGVFPRLLGGGYDDPNSDSAAVARILQEEFGSPDSDLVIDLAFPESATSPEAAAAGKNLSSQIASVPDVLRVSDFWATGAAPLLSSDGNSAIILVTFDPNAPRQPSEITNDIYSMVDSAEASGELAGATAYIGGIQAVFKSINGQISEDLAKSESIAVPISLVLLFIIFGSLVAAGMPLLVAGASILGSFFVLYVISLFTETSVFGLNLVTGLGLGLGIDYALLIVSRFREELIAQPDVESAVARTVGSAGRTVFFSGFTVGVTLAALLFFPQYFLRSFAYAGISVVIFAMIGAILLLPAVLSMIGPRVNSLRIRRNVAKPSSGRRWAALATFIMKYPWPVALAAIALLGILAWPAMGVKFNQADERALPVSDRTVVSIAEITDNFPGLGESPIEIMIPAGVPATEVADYATRLSQVSTITAVSSQAGTFMSGARVADPMPTATYASAQHERLLAYSSERARSPAGEVVIADLRATSPPVSGALVGGVGAAYTDSQQGIGRALPWAIGWVLATVLILVFLFTGSVLLPIKAVILNVLSLAATMGVLVWVFQEEHLTWLVGSFVPTGALDTSVVVLTAIVAFGLSMDYEVFLLSRIKEEYEHTGDNVSSVAHGLAKSAGIITAAALLLAIVFAAFLTSSVTLIKVLGLGVAVAILLDASIVRVFLVPAFMRIAGSANWWAPRPLKKIYQRFGLHDV